ncbi:MAG: flavin reductase [Ruminococcus sp.]|nr:flavin reductase [Ruminococcus sp.]
MSNFMEISPYGINDNTFELIGKDWALVTAGEPGDFNTMTISWGGMGIMWNRPVAFTFIRPQRYTFGYTENNEFFSLCFFDDSYRKALSYCGSHSGRDVDKVKETGLTPAFTKENVPYFEEARLVLVCRKMYAQDLNAKSVIDADVFRCYGEDDYHRMYVSEIVKVLKR